MSKDMGASVGPGSREPSQSSLSRSDGFDPSREPDEIESALENLLKAAERHIFGDECKAERKAALDALTLAKRRRGLRRMTLLDEEMEPREKPSETERRYHELLYAVSQKYAGEDRHETALRYIRERDSDGSPEGGDACGSVEDDSAGPKDIAHNPGGDQQ